MKNHAKSWKIIGNHRKSKKQHEVFYGSGAQMPGPGILRFRTMKFAAHSAIESLFKNLFFTLSFFVCLKMFKRKKNGER